MADPSNLLHPSVRTFGAARLLPRPAKVSHVRREAGAAPSCAASGRGSSPASGLRCGKKQSSRWSQATPARGCPGRAAGVVRSCTCWACSGSAGEHAQFRRGAAGQRLRDEGAGNSVRCCRRAPAQHCRAFGQLASKPCRPGRQPAAAPGYAHAGCRLRVPASLAAGGQRRRRGFGLRLVGRGYHRQPHAQRRMFDARAPSRRPAARSNYTANAVIPATAAGATARLRSCPALWHCRWPARA